MAESTNKLGLYLPGGGSSGAIQPDEAVDIDRINDNMRKIDKSMGAQSVTSTTHPSEPFKDQLIHEADTGITRLFNGTEFIKIARSFSQIADIRALVGTPQGAPGVWDGKQPLVLAAGTTISNTNGSGLFTHGFPTPFPNGVIAVIGFNGDGNVWRGYFTERGSTATHMRFQTEGPVITGGTIRCNFIAVGY